MEILDAVGDIGYPVDVIVMRTERFNVRNASSAELRIQLTSMGASSMKPLDPDAESLLREWIEKAEADLEVARRMASEAADNRRIREIVGFHCQQAVEKYLKALLTFYQVEFPKTHQIQRLLILVSGVNRAAADTLAGAKWLGPFGVEIRYPGDTAEILPGGEVKALEIASQVRQACWRS